MARVHPQFMDTVCLIYGQNQRPLGTGFLYDYPLIDDDNETKYWLWLVTCKHVVEDQAEVFVAFNRKKKRDSHLFRILAERWIFHPEADVAVTPMIPAKLQQEGGDIDWDFWTWEKVAIGRERAVEEGLSEVDEIAVVGFPAGWANLTGGNLFDLNHPLVRVGVLAQIQGWLSGDHDTFLIDCPIFDGSSGAAVCLVPTDVAINGTNPQLHSYLIGMVTGKLYADVEGTGRTALDLGRVTPLDSVNEVIDLEVATKLKRKSLMRMSFANSSL